MLQKLSFEKIVLLFIIFIAGLIAVRVSYSGSIRYIFLLWNIFLAWIPMFISGYLAKRGNSTKWKQGLLIGAWLLFFPNALYIITDLIHLENTTSVPKWFDATLIFSCAIAGLMMAFVSLYRVEEFLSARLARSKVEMLTGFFLFLGSFGVYLGRFLRWNSWDIISNPFALIVSISGRLLFPWQHLHTWSVTFILTVVFYFLYHSLKKIPRC